MGTLTVCTATHSGIVRELNEDSVLSDPDLGLIAVADGMGGHNAGEVASRLALDSLQHFVRMSAESQDCTWPCAINPQLSWNGNRLCAAMTLANRVVFKAAEERSAFAGMGTTVVAALVQNQFLTFSSVGDSRLYELTGGVLRQLSRDDSWIAMFEGRPGIDASSLRDHPMRNVLTRVIGAAPTTEIATTDLVMRDGHIVLLCTDGLHGALPDEEIATIISEHPDLREAADALVAAAVSRDGSDNVSLVLTRYSESASDSGREDGSSVK